MRGRTSTTVVGVSLLLVVAAACTSGSGRIVERSVSVGSFSKIEVSGGFRVDVTFGQDEAVRIEADDNVIDEIDTRVDGDTLRIGLRQTNLVDAALLAHVTARAVTGVTGNGASHVTFNGEESVDAFALDLSAASSFDGTLDAGRADIGASGAGNAVVSGSATSLAIEASGASSIDAEHLEAVDLEVSLSGASHASVTATESISADVSGVSSLQYGGSATFTQQDVSGGSSIQRLP